MKVKEVLQQTGLTDRAVRLYIANGLIEPECKKSYMGRNSIDFSDEDVALLNQIALLRKAGFSIEQIRTLQQGGESAREMVQAFLEEKRTVQKNTRIVLSALENLPAEELPSMDSVCRCLTVGFSEKSVPKEDMQPTVMEQVEAWFFRIGSILLIGFFGLIWIGWNLDIKERFLFPKLYLEPLYHIGPVCILLALICSAVVLGLYAGSRLNLRKRKSRRCAAWILSAAAVFAGLNPYGQAALLLFSPVYSETNDPQNYLQMGIYEQMYADSIYKLFPPSIPRSAVDADSAWFPPDKFPDTTQYYYLHEDIVDPVFDIFAQWQLSSEELEAERERIDRYFPEGAVYRENRGDWVCLHFTQTKTEDIENLHGYYFLIFAYNPKTSTVRYIASYAMDTGGGVTPYFMSMEW